MAKSYKQDALWVVELGEDEWYGVGPSEQSDLKNSFKVEARASKCTMLCVFVTPDALFPMYGQTKRHKVLFEEVTTS